MTPATVVDAIGMLCPVPVRLLARSMATLSPGDCVDLRADDPLVQVDVPAWCHTHGHAVEVSVDPKGGWRLVVVHSGVGRAG